MAELVDALASGASVLTDVEVRVLFVAPYPKFGLSIPFNALNGNAISGILVPSNRQYFKRLLKASLSTKQRK